MTPVFIPRDLADATQLPKSGCNVGSPPPENTTILQLSERRSSQTSTTFSRDSVCFLSVMVCLRKSMGSHHWHECEHRFVRSTLARINPVGLPAIASVMRSCHRSTLRGLNIGEPISLLSWCGQTQD